MRASPGSRFRQALAREKPLQVVGVIHAYAALQAEQAGFQALYLSGAGVANASCGLPDLAMTSVEDVAIDVRRITAATSLPLLVDADTGWGSALMVQRSIQILESAGAAGVHLEDQIQAKRCGHRPNKELVSSDEMSDRIRAAVQGRRDPSFLIMARTDAVASEGVEAAVSRARAYVEAGADLIFAEAVTQVEDYACFAAGTGVPVLANMTEFGKTPLRTTQELADVGVSMVLYPLSAFRSMSSAAEHTYRSIRLQGTQSDLLNSMQTREELYKTLRYHDYEARIDAVLEKTKLA